MVAVEAGLLLAEVPNLEGACEAITVTPATTRLEITNTATLGSQQVTFSANITPADCVDAEDERVAWGVDRPDVASISAAGVLTLLQPFAGTLTVSAYAGHLQAHARRSKRICTSKTTVRRLAGASALLERSGVAPDDVAICPGPFPHSSPVSTGHGCLIPGDRADPALALRTRPDERAGQHPLRPAICDVGADRRQRLVGHSVLWRSRCWPPCRRSRAISIEAASIDGAGWLQRFRSITLPFLAPTIAITVLLRTVWVSNFADLIVVMTSGGPADRTQIVASYIFTQAFRRLDFGYASAIALVLLVLQLAYSMLDHPAVRQTLLNKD